MPSQTGEGIVPFTCPAVPQGAGDARELLPLHRADVQGVLDVFFYVNPTMNNRVLERFARVNEVPRVRFYTKIDLKSNDTEFRYAKAAAGKDINLMVVEKSAVIKFDKHVSSRVFSPDELESLDSYMMKCCNPKH